MREDFQLPGQVSNAMLEAVFLSDHLGGILIGAALREQLWNIGYLCYSRDFVAREHGTQAADSFLAVRTAARELAEAMRAGGAHEGTIRTLALLSILNEGRSSPLLDCRTHAVGGVAALEARRQLGAAAESFQNSLPPFTLPTSPLLPVLRHWELAGKPGTAQV